MCLHTPCKLMILLDDLLTLTHLHTHKQTQMCATDNVEVRPSLAAG